MSTTNDGGPAFPTKGGMLFYVPEGQAEDVRRAIEDAVKREHQGLSLRDWFAGQAMRAIVMNDDYCIEEGRRLLAINCYQLADAMLAERAKP